MKTLILLENIDEHLEEKNIEVHEDKIKIPYFLTTKTYFYNFWLFP